MNMRFDLAACGVIAALAVSVAGCSSGGSSTPSGGATPNTSVGASTAAAAAGGGGATPSWAAALGSGVTVVPPASTSPGLGSPQAAVAGDVADIESGQYLADCAYVVPDEQSECKSSISSVQASLGPSALASAAGTVTKFGLGYTAIDGDEALVGTTGTFCSSGSGSSPSCFTNTDPAAIFSSGKSFATLWTEANSSNNSSSVYSLAPCKEVDGKWYLDDES
jgi:hypothetical protein